MTVSADELREPSEVIQIAMEECYGRPYAEIHAALRQGEVSQPKIVDASGNNPRDAGTFAIELLRRLEWDDEGRCIECGYLRKHTMGCGVGVLLDETAHLPINLHLDRAEHKLIDAAQPVAQGVTNAMVLAANEAFAAAARNDANNHRYLGDPTKESAFDAYMRAALEAALSAQPVAKVGPNDIEKGE